MIAVGLTGSIATGKTEVARQFSAAGIPVFDSDAEVHALYARKSTVQRIGKLFPDVVINAGIDRKRLGQRVLASPRDLEKLEHLVHPAIRKSRQQFISRWQKRNCPLVILDIPLLYETGADQELDYVIVVSTDGEVQKARALARPGMTPEKLEGVLARQLPAPEKCRRADFIIENSGTLEQLRSQVDALISRLQTLAGDNKP